MRKILSLVLALAMLLGMCSFAAADDIVTLEWYVLEGSAASNQMVWDAINEYMAEKIGVKINFHYILGDEYTSKMSPMMMNGAKGIDIVNVNGQLPYVEWAKKGAFVPMDDLLQYAPETAALVGEDFFNAMRIDGKIYAIPSVKDSVQMYSARFNKTLNEQLGLTIPTEINGYFDMVDYLYEAKAARDAVNPELSEMGIPITRCYADFDKWVQFESINKLLGTNVEGIPGIAAAAADGSEVFSIFQTEEYAKMCRTIMQMRLDGLLYNGDVWYYDSDKVFNVHYVLNDIGSGWVEAGQYADDPVQKRWETAFVPFKDNVAMTSYLHQAANAITVDCKYPEKAMQALELINTDEFVATALRFGLEGIHYTLNEDGTLFTDDPSLLNYNNDNNFYWYGAQFGALVKCKVPASKGTAQFMDKLAEANAKAKAGNMGFIFDPSPVQNELAACSAKIDEFNTNLKFGKHETMADVDAALAAFSAALDEAGIQKVVEECQRQLDAFLGK